MLRTLRLTIPSVKVNPEPQKVPYQEGPAQILPNLYLGSVKNCEQNLLERLGIQLVVNCAVELDVHVPQPTIKYGWTHHQDLSHELQRATSQIIEALSTSRVLVHCHEGISRSAILVIAVVMKLKDYTFSQAYEFVKSRSPCISPNVVLVSQLVSNKIF
ncbi:protein-tyrosine phosphatase-like protein [Gorgonomyces haynaldii]|nr:protein-tyrosine phosphatase-like protein [Gorgonomyces haynaldii]